MWTCQVLCAHGAQRLTSRLGTPIYGTVYEPGVEGNRRRLGERNRVK